MWVANYSLKDIPVMNKSWKWIIEFYSDDEIENIYCNNNSAATLRSNSLGMLPFKIAEAWVSGKYQSDVPETNVIQIYCEDMVGIHLVDLGLFHIYPLIHWKNDSALFSRRKKATIKNKIFETSTSFQLKRYTTGKVKFLFFRRFDNLDKFLNWKEDWALGYNSVKFCKIMKHKHIGKSWQSLKILWSRLSIKLSFPFHVFINRPNC